MLDEAAWVLANMSFHEWAAEIILTSGTFEEVNEHLIRNNSDIV